MLGPAETFNTKYSWCWFKSKLVRLPNIKWLDALRGSTPARVLRRYMLEKVSMQYDAMQYHAKQSKTIQYLQYKEIPCNTLFKSFKTSTGPMGFVFSSWMVPYGLQQCWMSRVFRCDALDTPQGYISNTKNIPQKWGHGNLGHFTFGPKWALFGPPGTQKGPNTRSK